MSFFSSIGNFFSGVVDTIKNVGSAVDDLIIHPVVTGDIGKLGQNLIDVTVKAPLKDPVGTVINVARTVAGDPSGLILQSVGNTLSVANEQTLSGMSKTPTLDTYLNGGSVLGTSLQNQISGINNSSIASGIPSILVAKVNPLDTSKITLTALKDSIPYDISLPIGKDVNYYSPVAQSLINEGYILSEQNKTLDVSKVASGLADILTALKPTQTTPQYVTVAPLASGSTTPNISITNNPATLAPVSSSGQALTNPLTILNQAPATVVKEYTPYAVEKPVIVTQKETEVLPVNTYTPFLVPQTTDIEKTYISEKETVSWTPVILVGIGIVSIMLLLKRR